MLVAFAEPPETSSRGRTLSSSTLVLSTSTSTSTATTSSSNRNSSSACYLPKWTVVSLNDRPNRFSLFRFVSFFFLEPIFFFAFPDAATVPTTVFVGQKKIFLKKRDRERERERNAASLACAAIPTRQRRPCVSLRRWKEKSPDDFLERGFSANKTPAVVVVVGCASTLAVDAVGMRVAKEEEEEGGGG